MKISITSDTCIKCGKCVKVCPTLVFTQESKQIPVVAHAGWCIGCAHCVSACPTDSVEHELFPPDKIHKINYEERATPESLMLLLKSRRTNRVFKKEPVPQEYLDKIIEAAHSAPTASNKQSVRYTLITDRKKLDEIIDFTISVFESKLKFVDNGVVKPILKKFAPEVYGYIPMIREFREQFKKGNDLILRNATSMLIIHSPKASRFGGADCNLAYQNGSLMAESLGVSQVYTGFVITAIKSNPKKFAQIIGSQEVVHAAMGLGMPVFKYPNYADRKPVSVKKI